MNTKQWKFSVERGRDSGENGRKNNAENEGRRETRRGIREEQVSGAECNKWVSSTRLKTETYFARWV